MQVWWQKQQNVEGVSLLKSAQKIMHIRVTHCYSNWVHFCSVVAMKNAPKLSIFISKGHSLEQYVYREISTICHQNMMVLLLLLINHLTMKL